LDAAPVICTGRGGGIEWADAVTRFHCLKVAAGRERLASAGQDDAADRVIGIASLDGLDKVDAILVGSDGAPTFGAVQRQGDHPSALIVKNVRGGNQGGRLDSHVVMMS